MPTPRRTSGRADPKRGASLDEYQKKREQAATPEPFGESAPRSRGPGVGAVGLFVMQKHGARRTHYDLRLELDGVLKSWAVPKGPSLDPKEKRLAVETEDHPLEYGDFEGVIPEGQYGAGAMIVWDRGTWVPLEDPIAGFEHGKLLFELRGHKLRGVWTIFRTKPPAIHRGKSKDEGKQWLLMKKPDAAASVGEAALSEASILSGLTVEELAIADSEESPRIARLRERIRSLGPKRRWVEPQSHKLMLAQSEDVPFSREGWIYELKYDGYRLLGAKRDGLPFLRYRNGHDATALFPEIARAVSALPASNFLLDGEVVVLDGDGRPSFNLLQKRALLSRSLDIERASLRTPASLFCFDLIGFDGFDLRSLPVVERKSLLAALLPPAGPLRYLEHIDQQGVELFQQIERMGLEGMVAKKADSTYVGRRSSHWLKYRVEHEDDFVIVGLTRPKGNRSGFGALHLALWQPEPEGSSASALVYAGRVGTGFNQQQLDSISERLEPLIRQEPAFRGEAPRGDRHVWVEPELVCAVRYKERTPQGLLRHPVFVRLRDDKPIEECTAQDEPARDEPPTQQARPKPTSRSSAKAPKLTNLDKVFWPEEGYTKGDLIDYYRKVAPWMLRYLEDRPVVLTRYPDGILGKWFFQKHAPDHAPDWIRTETIWSEGSERDIDYFVCNDERSLLYLANLGTIPIHFWSSRMSSLARPDWCILDLDPKDAPFSDVVRVAKEIHGLCDQIGLPSFPKTSGSSGLHVLLPLGAACSYEQSRTLGMLIARLTASRLPEIATVARTLDKREGRVYIDFVQNGHGRLLVAPFCLRPLPGAPVSTPLHWREVTPKLELKKHNIRSVPRRLARQKKEPMAEILDLRPDLVAALDALSRLV